MDRSCIFAKNFIPLIIGCLLSQLNKSLFFFEQND